MNGVINIDKPAGITSHDVVYRVRKIVGQKRVGHAGTLDPDATGVLLVCLGHATRLSDLLAAEGKSYEAVLLLGVTTTTEDSSGTLLESVDPSHITEANVRAILPSFTGLVQQIPPMVSAVHHNGQRLYDLARQGITVEREERTIEIESIELTSFTPGPEASASIIVRCGKGTYIRTLCADIGKALNVGGHMATLRRTSVGQFDIASSVKLENLTKENFSQYVTPSSESVGFLPRKELNEQEAADVLNGKQISSDENYQLGQIVRMVSQSELLALARVTNEGTLQPEKVFPPAG